MKGAMSSPTRQLWHELCRQLYPTSTYGHNSGGDPVNIPDLTHQQLGDFYNTYYHPGNAIFFTFGNQPASFSQQLFAQHLLSRRQYTQQNIPTVKPEQRFSEPKRIIKEYPIDDANSERKTHVVMGWLLGQNIDLNELLKANLLALLLLDNASSPLRQKLEESSLGQSPSPLCGVEDDQFEMVFCAGLEGCESDSADDIEALILQELSRLADVGFDDNQVEACMHQLELSQRDISSGSMPYGLSLILGATSTAVHGGDVVKMLDLDKALKQLRHQLSDRHYAKSLVSNLLLNNPHRVTLVMKPKVGLNEWREKQQQQQLDQYYQTLTPKQVQTIVDNNEQLERRQQQPEDESCLPTVTIEDIRTDSVFLKPNRVDRNRHFYGVYCNGLDYLHAQADLSLQGLKQTRRLPLLTAILGELGQGKDSYAITQNQIAANSGGMNFGFALRQPLQQQGNDYPFYLNFSASSKGLHRKFANMLDLLQQQLQQPNLSEQAYIRDLIAQLTLSSYQRINANGHAYAMRTAASYFSIESKCAYHWSGLKFIQQLIELNKQLDQSEHQKAFIQELSELHQHIINDWQRSQQWLMISDEGHLNELEQATQPLNQALTNRPAAATAFNTDDFTGIAEKVAPKIAQKIAPKIVWATETTVNYCAQAYQAVGLAHDDAAALFVLASYLRDRYLHTAIRERGGAYGGGAQFDPQSQTLRFFSYRDPRCQDTFNDFNQAIQQASDIQAEKDHLQQAIFSVSARLSSPLAPPQQAQADYHASRIGIDKAHRDQLRKTVIEVTAADLQRVTQTYLQNQANAIAVISSKKQAIELQDDGFAMEELYL